MKIDKIQCDICGKMVDYNGKKIGDMVSNKLLTSNCLFTDGAFYEEFKTNWLIMRGIINGKNMQESIDKEVINMEFDLCDDCLIELYKMINKYINEVRK